MSTEVSPENIQSLLLSDKNIDHQLDMLYDMVHSMINDEQWDKLDEICKIWDLSCGLELTLGLLTVTLHNKTKCILKNRDALFKRATIYYNTPQRIWMGLE